MTTAIKEELDKIVKVLVETGAVAKVILFGSFARGEGTPKSDFDICVLTSVKDEGRRITETSIGFRAKLLKVQKRALDLITFNQDDFFSRAARPRSFPNHIMEYRKDVNYDS